MSDIDIYKAITPLDYLGSGMSFVPEATIGISTGTNQITWSITAGNYQVNYNTVGEMILMDQFTLSMPSVSNRYPGYRGIINYNITLLNSPDHYLRRYCRICFGSSFSGSALSGLSLNILVTTPWMDTAKQFSIACVPSTGTINPMTITTPNIDVDWTDPVTIRRNITLLLGVGTNAGMSKHVSDDSYDELFISGCTYTPGDSALNLSTIMPVSYRILPS